MQITKSHILCIWTNFSLLFLGFALIYIYKTTVAQSEFSELLIILVILLPTLRTLYRIFKPFTLYNLALFLVLFLVLLFLNTALFLRAFVYSTTSNGCYNPWF